MKSNRRTRSERKRDMAKTSWSPAELGVDTERYQAVLQYLFDRPSPVGQQQKWYWEEAIFEATSLKWVQFQTLIFSNAANSLAPYSDEQVGMGLSYLIDSAFSEVPFAALDTSVPLEDTMKMMRAMPSLWRDCIGPRLRSIHAPIGSCSGGELGYACYMWFDVWPTFYHVRNETPWRDAVWDVLNEMLQMPYREVQIAALHGIGHTCRDLDREAVIDKAVNTFLARIGNSDPELSRYAEAARKGAVQ